MDSMLPMYCAAPFSNEGNPSLRSSFVQCEGLGGIEPATRCLQFLHKLRAGGRNGKTKAAIMASPPKREKDSNKRVVITGMDLVSVFGSDVDTFYDKLLEGQSGIGFVGRFDASPYSVRFAGQIRGFSAKGYIDGKNDRRLDDCWRYGLVSGKMVLENADLGKEKLDKVDKSRVGVLLGAGIGGITTYSAGIETLAQKGYQRITPFLIPYTIPNMGSALLAIDTGLMGPTYSISTACATDSFIVPAGGTDSFIVPAGVGGFIALRALSQRNDDTHRASRPWDKDRDGFVMGEGAGVLVMESLEHAMKRGAPIIAEYLGGAVTCDAYHMTDPRSDGLGVSMCIRKTLENAGVSPEEVNYINAHAISARAGDLAEVNAIKKVFKDASGIKMNGTKSMIGRCLGAAGALEAIATIKAINTGWLHPTINQFNTEPDVTIDTVPNVKKQHEVYVDEVNSSFARSSFAQYEGLRGIERATHYLRFLGRRNGKTKAAIMASAPKREKDSKKRIVITGMGLVSVFGSDVDTFYDKLLEGQSGIGFIDRFDASPYSVRFAGQIRGFSANGYIEGKNDRRLDDCWRYGLVSGKMALENADLGMEKLEKVDKNRVGVLLGAGIGGITTFCAGMEALVQKRYQRITPFLIPYTIPNMGSALLAIETGFMGPTYSISTACATANYCFYAAANHIRGGDVDIMLAGGTDAFIVPAGVGGFIALRALSQRNDDPQRASRPWDKDRDGFVMGEGAGVLVMESLEHAMKRGAPIIAEYLGGAVTCDAYHMTDPHSDGLGVSMCIRKTLENAGVSPEEVNYINAHATSTRAGDLAEVNAIKKVFKDTSGIKMNGTKSMIGHSLGAAGALEAIATIKAITTGWLHPTINQFNTEPDVTIDTVPNVKKQHEVHVGISNSFGFGGHNSVVAFAPFNP